MSENTNGAAQAPKPIIETASAADAFAEDAAAQMAADTVSTGNKGGKSFTGSFQDATIGFFEGVGRVAWAYADAHPHATLYGILGFVLAVLILVIGLWDTIVIAVFVIVGVIIGQMVDGKSPAVNFMNRWKNSR